MFTQNAKKKKRKSKTSSTDILYLTKQTIWSWLKIKTSIHFLPLQSRSAADRYTRHPSPQQVLHVLLLRQSRGVARSDGIIPPAGSKCAPMSPHNWTYNTILLVLYFHREMNILIRYSKLPQLFFFPIQITHVPKGELRHSGKKIVHLILF